MAWLVEGVQVDPKRVGGGGGELKCSCSFTIYKKIKNIKNVKRCRDGMSKSMQTR